MRVLFSCSVVIILLLTLSACATTTSTRTKADPLRHNGQVLFRDLTIPYHEVKR